MSTGKQEASIPAQRESVRKLAEREDYHILREYSDEGISGDDTEKRTEFLRMRRDAKELGDFDVILCWDQDRFGRFDTLDAGYWIKPIRDAGVQLVTVAQGKIDWENFSGRLIYTIQQEGKHQFLVDMSRNVVRGMLAKARRGEWLGGRVPYAYRLQDKRLVLGPEEEIRVVRWLFTEYAFHGRTMGELMDRLNADKVPGPGGKLWGKTSIYKILQRPVYSGLLAWNRRHEGKFHEVRGGEIAATGRMKTTVRANGPEDWIVAEVPHLALVDRAVFDRVQRKLVENRDRSTPHRGKRVFLLTGLLFCAGCGWPMHGAHLHRHKHRPGYNRYICGNYNLYRKQGGCLCNTLQESELLDVLAEKVAEHFRRPEICQALREEVCRQEMLERQGQDSPVASFNTRIAELDRKIDEGTEKWLGAPASLTDLIGNKLEEWRKERDRLHAERRQLAKPAPSLGDLDAAVDKILAGMDSLRENIAADPAGAKAVLREIVEKVECRFTHVPYGKKQKSVLTGGTIHIREDVLVCRPVPLARPLTIVTPARTKPDARRSAIFRPYAVQPREPTSATALASASVSMPRRYNKCGGSSMLASDAG
jgi:DNA invertase Pin-like site-specific DNA recombinase